jgi:[acyl-carrier-protein] S-malonyltransferase
MGRALCDEFAVARATFAEADEVLGWPLSRLCFEGPLDELTLTANTQPALLATSTALSRVLRDEIGISPACAAGHSLGEISALVCAGAFSFSDALRLVRERGKAMQQAVAPGIGGMAAIFGLDLETVEAICRSAAQEQTVSPANLNGGGQIVIAGHQPAVDRVIAAAKARGAKRALSLNVSAPFHCSLMQPAADHLRAVLAPLAVREPSFPVISNVAARPYRNAEEIKDLLVRQVVSPVRWEECVQQVAVLGYREAIEVGPGRVLSGLVKRISETLRCTPGEEIEAVRGLVSAA